MNRKTKIRRKRRAKGFTSNLAPMTSPPPNLDHKTQKSSLYSKQLRTITTTCVFSAQSKDLMGKVGTSQLSRVNLLSYKRTQTTSWIQLHQDPFNRSIETESFMNSKNEFPKYDRNQPTHEFKENHGATISLSSLTKKNEMKWMSTHTTP